MNPGIELLAFSGLMALGQFSPGPDMILITRTSLARGAGAGAWIAWGIATGLAVHTTVAIGGLAVAFETLPILHAILTWAAAAYLLWLASQMLKAHLNKSDPTDSSQEIPAVSGHPYARGLICNLLNPKAVIFIAATCAPFLQGSRPVWWPVALWCLVVLQGGLLWTLWARLLQWHPLRSRYQRAVRWIDTVFAIALIGLAVRLVIAA